MPLLIILGFDMKRRLKRLIHENISQKVNFYPDYMLISVSFA